MNLFIKQKQTHRLVNLWSPKGKMGAGGGINWGLVWTYTYTYLKQIADKDLLYREIYSIFCDN